MNNLFSFGCPQHVYRTSPNNNNRTPEATAATARVGAAVPSAATVVPPIRRRLSTSTANIFRRLFGLPTKYKSLKSRAIVLSTATMASSIEATPNRGPSKQQNQISGQLYKYTNVVKGWQYRWFTVDPQAGTLSYYLCETTVDDSAQPVVGSSPRWQEHLAGAVVCPSDEDSRTFTISCASGDILKLRAINARARQEWVDGLRNIAECHTQSIGSQFEMLPLRDVVAASDAFGEARQQLHNTELCNAALARAIENASHPLTSTDPDLLLLKAISASSTQCLLQCMSLLQRHHEYTASDVRSEAAF